MHSLSQPRKFYAIAELSMIVAGSALLLFSVADIVNPRTMCQENLDAGRIEVLVVSEPSLCIYPMFEIR